MKTKVKKDFIEKEFNDSLASSNIDNDLYLKYNVKKGLRNANGSGVLVLLTKISDVYGYKMIDDVKTPDQGHLYYRGYDIYDLAPYHKQKYGYERICFLILFGHLPNDDELEDFHKYISSLYELPNGFIEDHILKSNSSSIMNQMQRAILTLYSYDKNPDDISPEATLEKGLNLIAKMPAVMSYSYRAKKHYIDGLSLHIRKPREDYSIAENILHMSRRHGDFTLLEAETLDLALILHADHGGGNNSTFTNIVISSTGTDIYSSVCGSLGSLKGPRHGGASKAVNDMMKNVIKEVGLNASDDKIRDVVRRILDGKFNDNSGLIYGIGHAVYTINDPRAILLKEKCHELAIMEKEEKRFDFYDRFQRIAIEELKLRKGKDYCCCTNVDFYSGLTYTILKINEDLFLPIFACSRLLGWIAHNIENRLYSDKIIRPAGMYVGDIKKEK